MWRAGYVPQDKPGASGYFTPRSSALYANDCFDHADCTSRNPVMSQLNGELHRNPFRHRTARKLHTHLRVSKVANPFPPWGASSPLPLKVILVLPSLSSPNALISTLVCKSWEYQCVVYPLTRQDAQPCDCKLCPISCLSACLISYTSQMMHSAHAVHASHASCI